MPLPEKKLAEETKYIAPSTPEEKLLCGIWSEVLNVEGVGIRHDFFDLGGHSLIATRLISRIRDQFGKNLELRYLFEHPTVEQLCRIILKTEQKLPSTNRGGIRRSKRKRRTVSVSADGDIHRDASGS